MTILYSDSIYPGKDSRYVGKTMGQILREHISPKRFISTFESANRKYSISDELALNPTRGKFTVVQG